MAWLAVVFALASATSNAASGATQHHAAGMAGADATPSQLMRFLIRRPDWIIAILLGPVGFSLHILALSHGPLALVQPIVILGIVFAIPLRSAWDRAWPSLGELGAVALTAAAIAALLLASSPQPAEHLVAPGSLLPALLACDVVALLVLASTRAMVNPTKKAFLLGSAAGLLYGLMAVLMEASTSYAAEHGVAALTMTWLPWLCMLNGVSGVVINQVAFKTARLSASMPVLNVVNCLLALGFAYLVLHEQPREGSLALIVGAFAVVAMTIGLVQLARIDDRHQALLAAERAEPQRV